MEQNNQHLYSKTLESLEYMSIHQLNLIQDVIRFELKLRRAD